VTYFLNGGREVEFPGERRGSSKVRTCRRTTSSPEMSAPELTDEAVGIITEEDPDLMVLNYANPDMVGHTGDFDAAVEAVEAVDAQLHRLLDAVADAGGHAVVTADHGNADDMGTLENPTPLTPSTRFRSSTTPPDSDDGGCEIRNGGRCVTSPRHSWT